MKPGYANEGKEPFIYHLPAATGNPEADNRRLKDIKSKARKANKTAMNLGIKSKLEPKCSVCGRHGGCTHKVAPGTAYEKPKILGERVICQVCGREILKGKSFCPECGVSEPERIREKKGEATE